MTHFDILIGDSVDVAVEGLYFDDKQILDSQELREHYSLDVFDLYGFSDERLERFGWDALALYRSAL